MAAKHKNKLESEESIIAFHVNLVFALNASIELTVFGKSTKDCQKNQKLSRSKTKLTIGKMLKKKQSLQK